MPGKIVYPEDTMRKDFLHVGEGAKFPLKIQKDDPRWYLTPPDVLAKKQVSLMKQGYTKEEANRLVSNLAFEKEYTMSLESRLLQSQADKAGITSSPYYEKELEKIMKQYSSIRSELFFQHKVKSRGALENLIEKIRQKPTRSRPRINRHHLKMFYIPKEVVLEHLTMRPEDKKFFDTTNIFGEELKTGNELYEAKKEPHFPIWTHSESQAESLTTSFPEFLSQKIKLSVFRRFISNPDYESISLDYEKALDSIMKEMNEKLSSGDLQKEKLASDITDDELEQLRRELEEYEDEEILLNDDLLDEDGNHFDEDEERLDSEDWDFEDLEKE